MTETPARRLHVNMLVIRGTLQPSEKASELIQSKAGSKGRSFMRQAVARVGDSDFAFVIRLSTRPTRRNEENEEQPREYVLNIAHHTASVGPAAIPTDVPLPEFDSVLFEELALDQFDLTEPNLLVSYLIAEGEGRPLLPIPHEIAVPGLTGVESVRLTGMQLEFDAPKLGLCTMIVTHVRERKAYSLYVDLSAKVELRPGFLDDCLKNADSVADSVFPSLA